jgi:hypothetical protein
MVEGVAEEVYQGLVLRFQWRCDGPGGPDRGERCELVDCWGWWEAGEAESREIESKRIEIER